jgi:hypothetical protein
VVLGGVLLAGMRILLQEAFLIQELVVEQAMKQAGAVVVAAVPETAFRGGGCELEWDRLVVVILDVL